MLVCEIQKNAQCHIGRAKCISYNVPQKLTTTVCFIQSNLQVVDMHAVFFFIIFFSVSNAAQFFFENALQLYGMHLLIFGVTNNAMAFV